MRNTSFDHYGLIFEPQEALILLDAHERTIQAVKLDPTVEESVFLKIASVILSIGRQRQYQAVPLNAREIADEAVQKLNALRGHCKTL